MNPRFHGDDRNTIFLYFALWKALIKLCEHSGIRLRAPTSGARERFAFLCALCGSGLNKKSAPFQERFFIVGRM
jgi:hypothetical protein